MTITQPGTPGWLRARNDGAALSLLLEHGPLTRNRLGQLSGLSKPTAAQMVARLESAGLIEVVGQASAGRGPNAAMYGVRADRLRGVAVAIDEKSILATVIEATGTRHPTIELALPEGDRSPEADVRAAFDAAVAAAAVDSETVRIVCVGVQAAISDSGDRMAFGETLAGWPEFGARSRMEAELGIDVVIDNDVNLAAIAERSVGAAKDATSFALLWMGEGLGVAFDLSGTVRRGAAGGAGEIGYLPVPRQATAIAPEAEDLTDLIGGVTVAAIARAHGATGADLDDLLKGASENRALLDDLAPRIALGVIPVLAVLDPDVVVLGGPTGAAGGETLAGLVHDEIVRVSRWRPCVRATTVPAHPVLAGASEFLVGEIRARLHNDVDSLTP